MILHFLRKFSEEIGKEVRGLAPDAMAVLEGYAFPGNVRELESIIERAVVLCEGDVIQKANLELRSAEEERYLDPDIVPISLEELKKKRRSRYVSVR